MHEERFWTKVNVKEEDECWEWQAGADPDGYGQFWLDGCTQRAHRVAVAVDERDPSGRIVRHRCDNPACVNPGHLVLGTQEDNISDRDNRGRQARGARNGRAKLNPEDIPIIRRRVQREPISHVARDFGVSRKAIRNVRDGKSWTHV